MTREEFEAALNQARREGFEIGVEHGNMNIDYDDLDQDEIEDAQDAQDAQEDGAREYYKDMRSEDYSDDEGGGDVDNS